MNRREFMKNVVAGVAVTAMPFKIELSTLESLMAGDVRHSGKIREITAYSIMHDEILTRWDISDGKNQINVSTITSGVWNNKEKMKQVRKDNIGYLVDAANEKGLNLNNLIKLDMPEGINLVAA